MDSVRPRHSLTLLILLGLLAAGVAGAAAAGIAPDHTNIATDAREPLPTGKKTTAWEPAPARPGEIVYSSLGIRTMPSPANASPEFSESDVMAKAEVKGFIDEGLAPGEPSVALRLVTTGDFGPSDAQPIVAARDELAWVLSFHHSPVAAHGPIGATPAMPQDINCDFVVMVSANSGQGILYGQLCPPSQQ